MAKLNKKEIRLSVRLTEEYANKLVVLLKKNGRNKTDQVKKWIDSES